MSKEQAEGLQKSQQALVLDFVGPKEQASDHLRMACRIASDVARDTGGLLWDEETREVYTPEAWDQRRLEGWEGGAPFILNHIVIHAYSKGEYVRAITLGMAKFGVPDVVVENFSWGSNKNIGNIINLFAQALAEGAKIERLGEYDLDLHAIGNKEARDLHLKSLLDHAVAKAQLTLREGVREEGDPENRLVELGFDRYAGRDVHARQDAMISTLFGWRDAIKSVKPDTELNAASQRAKNQLPALKKVFNEGMAPGEFIQVKAPFGPAGDGREFMWVEVIAWESEKIKGLLKNEPFHIPSLHGGQIVEVEQKDVFDYIRHFADGRQTGNETGAILEKLDGIEEKR